MSSLDINLDLHIVLVEPEIPGNTGNIARTCVSLGITLHLIEPLGFSLDEKSVRRSGLDYWERLSVHTYPSLEAFFDALDPKARCIMATTKAKKTYADWKYRAKDYILFGKESAGLPEELLVQFPNQAIRIPMKEGERSLNLSNAAAIVAYEAFRQQGFPGLETQGNLHRLQWTTE